MGDRSLIEWTDASWNPATGCTKVSPGCDRCYAERMAERFRGVEGHPYRRGFDVQVHEDRMDQPLRWRRPRRIFVCSMSDLFHQAIPAAARDAVFTTMERAGHHVFQVLTKRSGALARYLKARYGTNGAPAHVWCGVSVEDRVRKARIGHLRGAPARVRFLSLEPLLEDLGTLDLDGIHWVIAGGESGPGARAMDGDWVRSIRDQCRKGSVPFFFKQWGGVRKKATGRTLDGVEHDAMPEAR